MDSQSELPSGPPLALPAVSVAAVFEGRGQPDAPTVHVQWFTDPFSAWCWAFGPTWLRLVETFGGLLSMEPIFTGLYRDEAEIRGSTNAFNEPGHIAMQWEEVAHLSGMPLDSSRWEKGGVSSWPACAAAKAAWRQDALKGWRYLRRLREAALCERRRLEAVDELLSLAREVDLDPSGLGTALEDGSAAALFQADLELAAETGAMTSPGFLFFGPGGITELRGARPFDEVVEAILSVCGDAAEVVGSPETISDCHGYLEALVEATGSLTAAEAAAVLQIERSDAADLLDRMAAAGRLARHPVGDRALYRPVSRT